MGGADFLPALRRFIGVAPQYDDEAGDDRPSPLDLAFRRVLELSPEEGHALILTELRRATPRATRESLTLLPDQPIPELDDLLATRLERSIHDLYDAELAAALVARYSLAELKKLLARFPAGTTLGFPTGMLADTDAEERFFTELQREVAAHDLKLVKTPPRQ